MAIVKLSSGVQFEVAEHETILDGALRAGIVLEHSCRTGRCGACKSVVESGITKAVLAETSLTSDERKENWVLTCAREAIGHVTLRADWLKDVVVPKRCITPCRIVSLDHLNENVMQVRLRMPPSTGFGFLPGQYVEVTAKNGVRRSYSIACAPRADQIIELHVRYVSGGAMSRYWFEEAEQGDLMRLAGPLGTFFLREHSASTHVFLATGTGIAPVKAILEGLAALPVADRPRKVHVFWGGRQPVDFYWEPRTIGFDFDFTPVLSRVDVDWTGARGHVQEALLASGLALENAVIYACGSPAMIDSARERLVSAGLDPRRFHSDAFVASS